VDKREERRKGDACHWQEAMAMAEAINVQEERSRNTAPTLRCFKFEHLESVERGKLTSKLSEANLLVSSVSHYCVGGLKSQVTSRELHDDVFCAALDTQSAFSFGKIQALLWMNDKLFG